MNRKFWWTTICLLGSFFVPIFTAVKIEDARFCRSKIGIIFCSYVLAANSDIIINEIGAYPSADHQWIEIWNKGNDSVDLSSWKFWEGATNHGLKADDPIVSPGEYAVIVQSTSTFLLDYPLFSGSIFDSSWGSFNKMDGEEIGLIDIPDNQNHANNHYVENFTYISAPDFSLQRRDPFLADYTSANWVEHTSGNTVGALNVFSTTVIPSEAVDDEGSIPTTTSPVSFLSIKLNEFVSDPESGNEWVELYNDSASSLDLAGGYICDSRNTTSTCKIITGAISPNGWLKIDLQTDSYLNNTGDSIILKNSNGDIIDQVIYDEDSAPEKGQSWARSADGSGDWQVTTQITPGAANVIMVPVSAQQSSGGGSVSTDSSTTSTKKTTTKTSVIKEKFVGLKWKIKYDLRLRQYEESVFDAVKSIDPRGGRINYSWNFTTAEAGSRLMAVSGTLIKGASVKYAFATSGPHIVIVRATSTAGTVDEKKLNIMVYPATETAGSGIIFSELMPRASTAEDEYIRLKNISNHPVNMSNWKLAYKNDVYEIPSSTFLAANDYLTFYQTVTGFTLNNTAGDLLLLNQDNILMDEVEYGKADEGIAYIFDGQKWNWAAPTTSAQVLGIKIDAPTTKKSSGRFYANIADARGGQKGDYARVKGVVAALPGVFGSQYFYLVDGNAGIQVYQNKKDFPPLEVGDSVQVYGMVSEANGIKRINVKSKDDVDILAIGGAVTSMQLNADEVDESLIGGLVRVEGEITEIKSSFMYLDNGSGETVVYFKQGAKIDKSKFKEGENVRVTGILEQTKTGWQVWPRSQSDIESLGPSADLLAKETVNKSEGTQSKFLTATVGGVATLILAFLARARGLVVLGGIKKIFKKDKE